MLCSQPEDDLLPKFAGLIGHVIFAYTGSRYFPFEYPILSGTSCGWINPVRRERRAALRCPRDLQVLTKSREDGVTVWLRMG